MKKDLIKIKSHSVEGLKKTVYPEPFSSRMSKREKRRLGDVFGLTKFGVNLTTLNPGGESALLHKHTRQEEFIFILEGYPILVTDEGEYQLEPGDCAGFLPGGPAHKLINRTNLDVRYIEIGDREKGDLVTYPEDDLVAEALESGKWSFKHKNGEPY